MNNLFFFKGKAYRKAGWRPGPGWHRYRIVRAPECDLEALLEESRVVVSGMSDEERAGDV